MFSTKIYVLSVFVFCLFNLGKAAPIIDEISSLSSRELPSLEARGIFDALFPPKLDDAAKKIVKNATDDASCHLYNAYVVLKKTHQHSLKSIEGQMNATSNAGVKKSFAKIVKKFKKLVTDAKKEVKKQEDVLKKHGIKDVAARCASHSNTHSDTHKSEVTSHQTKSDEHTLAATSHPTTSEHTLAVTPQQDSRPQSNSAPSQN